MRILTFALLVGTCFVMLCTDARAGPEHNVQVAKRVFLENLAMGRFERLDEIYGPGFVAHAVSRDYSLEQNNDASRSWRAAMPDLKVSVLRTVADRDQVAVHWHITGTNSVAAGGMPGNGDRIGIEGMTIYRFVSGHIVEEWSVIDIATLRNQVERPPPAHSQSSAAKP